MVVLISFAMFVTTLLGGILALRLQERLHLILGFSAGAILGAAWFDVIPEALRLAAPAHTPSSTLAIVAVGFLLYMILDRSIGLYGRRNRGVRRRDRGILGAASLSVHGFLDGVAVGLAYEVSAAVSAVVSAAVLMHTFSDGVGTVGIVLARKSGHRAAVYWLLANASAPVLGVLAAMAVSFHGNILGVCLAVFGGFFIYISASDLLPESFHGHPTGWTSVMTILGAVTLYIGVRLAQI